MYLALYRKWRPKVFSDVVSQEHITQTLQNQVRLGKTAHAYLFTGSRGTGKTTCSKILAKAVNCLHPVDGNPCLECEICRGIENGSILDVTEMDAASNNGVDDIRDLRDEASYTPSSCRYRVYIIDEVHMLSVSAFNALLKIMEEPPPHVHFILATTEIHKVPQTIVSRCQQYDFRRIRPADIAGRLLEVSENEDFTLTEEAARLIARLADGGMRDALSLLDQCVAFSDHVDPDVVASTAGIAGSEQIFALAEAILRMDAGAALRLVSELYENAKGIDRLCAEMISHFRDVLLCRSVSDPEGLVVCLPDELERLKNQAASVSLDRVMEILGGFQKCLDSLGRSVNKKVEMEMTVIRLCTGESTPVSRPASGEPAPDTAALTARIAELERMLTAGLQNLQQPAAPVRPRVPAPRPVQAAEPEPTGKQEPLAQWSSLLQELAVREPALYVLLQDSTASRSGNLVSIESPNAMLKKLLLADNIGARLADIVEEKLGSRHRLRVVKQEQKEAAEAPPALDDILQKAASRDVEVHVRE
ncbi:MAG: DNA polymerase III subunit gamma/tau [Oscillospiraceae bacterium]|nr:DNA polymerase III subunit gamma/tau [Oscillospiraceae bacterium]